MSTLAKITINIKNAPIRHETLHGKRFIVAPVAMLTEGVHAGSGGALLYNASECKKAVKAWNMKPIVVYHPEIDGKGVSACDPDILEKQQVGMVLHTNWNGKLRAEAWIEEARAAEVDGRVLDALENNKMMEVSTGLFTDNVGNAGEWNGEHYDAEATNHQPDHLALLPDRIGACSIADGAGLLQLNEEAAARGLDMTRLFTAEMDAMRRLVGNAMSHSNIFTALHKAARARLGAPENEDLWVVDVYDSFFIYQRGVKNVFEKLDYTADDKGVVVTGDPVEVIRVTEYRDKKAGTFVGNTLNQKKEEQKMNKNEMIDQLINNATTAWGEPDRDTLLGMDEATLAKMIPVENAAATAKGAAAPANGAAATAPAHVAQTVDEYVQQAPAELRDVLRNSLDTHNALKADLVEKIVANKRNKFSKEFLQAKGLQELQGLHSLCAADAETTPGTGMFYTGAATPPAAGITENAQAEEALPLPIMNFAG